MKSIRIASAITVLILVAGGRSWSQSGATATVTTPKEAFGFDLGDDYHLANYSQLTDYWKKLEQESDRLVLEEIGTTAEGRPMLMAIITSPENHRNLGFFKQISARMARAQGLTLEEAGHLARQGRAVVWIDGGLHATETLGAQQLMELVYQMVSRTDRETLRILDDVILLAVCANPDGLDLVADWYMRREDPEKRSVRGLPRLYQKYVGHDNNRDFYLVSQPETEAINRILFREWFPQIAYNHHQSGPRGTILFAPPFRDPFNYNLDPLLITSLELVGAAMHQRFVAEGKAGSTMRSGAGYSTWWNGGLRTTQYFHNIIGLLTETIGSPNPMEIPFILRRQLPHSDLPYPIEPQKWHFRQSVDYSITANRAVLDLASRHREQLLLNIYRMGRNSIERGSRDHWTIDAERIKAVDQAYRKENEEAGNLRNQQLAKKYFEEVFRHPEARDPRGYILPSDQADFPTAGKFINTLIKNGIEVLRAEADFEVGGKTYPQGSYVVKTDQAFRPHILDMFEPQHHPDDIPYPGGPPTPPYDSAGWTLAYQMGVEFDRILEGFDGPFQAVPDLVRPAPGRLRGPREGEGFLLSHRLNNTFIAINRLLQAGLEVSWLKVPFEAGGRQYDAGAVFVERGRVDADLVESLVGPLGVDLQGLDERPLKPSLALRQPRIGLWDRYGGSMPSGWIRWILEQYEFPFKVVFPQRLDQGSLRDDFDVLIFAGRAMPSLPGERQPRFRRQPPKPEEIPAEFRDRLGEVTVEKTIPQIRQFLEEGGAVVAIGSSASLAIHLGLPVWPALTEPGPDGTRRRLPSEKYYIPGSVLQMALDNRHPLGYGMPPAVNVYFNNNPVFHLSPTAIREGVKPVGWFDSESPLRSGWAWGQHYLKDTVGVLEAPVGSGKLFVFGPEVTFRAQPHGTFKFLFNALYYGPAVSHSGVSRGAVSGSARR